MTLGLLVPFVFLPAILWWVVPLTILGGTMILWRPSAWAWPLIMVAVAWPRTIGALVTGNTDLWVAAAVALGLTSGWPAALILLKPSAFPLMLVGLRAWRPFALAVCFIVVAGVIVLPLWGQYLVAVRNVADGPSVLYSLPSLPLLLLPVVAWIARTRRRPPTGPLAFLANLVAAVRRRIWLRVRS